MLHSGDVAYLGMLHICKCCIPGNVAYLVMLRTWECCVPGNVAAHGQNSVDKRGDSENRRQDQHPRVESEPGKVDPDLLTKILPERQK